MKICIASQTFHPQHEGGAEIVARNFAEHLCRKHEVVVLSLGLPGHPSCSPGETSTVAGYRVVRVPFHNAYLPETKAPQVRRSAKAIWHMRNALGTIDVRQIAGILQDEAIDLLYCHNTSRMQPALFHAAAQVGIPVCQHLHDYALMCPRTSMYTKGRNCDTPCTACRILTTRARTASESVGTVIAVSDFVRQRFRDNGMFAHADFHVLHNTNLDRDALDQTLIRDRPTPKPIFTFGYLGALSQTKGVETMLTAFLSLPQGLPVRLVIGGQGDPNYVASLRKLTAHLPDTRVAWLGHVRRETVFAQSEVVLVPSLWHEPQSLVLIEAATYGVPVIAARTGGTPEIVEGRGTGWCHDAGDAAALALLMRNAAEGGPAAWRGRLPSLFPGLGEFRGTADETDFFGRLETILTAAARRRL